MALGNKQTGTFAIYFQPGGCSTQWSVVIDLDINAQYEYDGMIVIHKEHEDR